MSDAYIILLSPAKRLQTSPFELSNLATQPYFTKEATALVKELSKLDSEKLKSVMDIKDAMVEEVMGMLNNWGAKGQPNFPAAALYNGDAYLRLGAREWSKKDWTFAKEHLRILSAVYGVLSATDLIFPYRLMVGANWKGRTAPKGLYPYWKDRLSDYALENWGDSVILNLASQEYAEMLQNIPNPKINVDFKVNKQGRLITVSSFSKQARGAMARWIIENQPKKISSIKKQTILDFQFSSEHSDNENWIFVKS
jgi:cytoplasmic iron level regulating protein YaaA (DUF328/UPF0246 family)